MENDADRELRELFNVCWHPSAFGRLCTSGTIGKPSETGVYGNIFDVLVDWPARAKATFGYPVVWAAGDVDLSGPWPAALKDYAERGGTLVVNAAAARGKLP